MYIPNFQTIVTGGLALTGQLLSRECPPQYSFATE